MAVDLALYPLDTIKTRLQASTTSLLDVSRRRALYSGVNTMLIGSAPSCTASVFLIRCFIHGSGCLLVRLFVLS